MRYYPVTNCVLCSVSNKNERIFFKPNTLIMFQNPIFTTGVDTVGTSAVLLNLPPSIIQQAPMIDLVGQAWQAPVIGLASSVIIQLAMKAAKFLIGLLTKKITPKASV